MGKNDIYALLCKLDANIPEPDIDLLNEFSMISRSTFYKYKKKYNEIKGEKDAYLIVDRLYIEDFYRADFLYWQSYKKKAKLTNLSEEKELMDIIDNKINIFIEERLKDNCIYERINSFSKPKEKVDIVFDLEGPDYSLKIKSTQFFLNSAVKLNEMQRTMRDKIPEEDFRKDGDPCRKIYNRYYYAYKREMPVRIYKISRVLIESLKRNSLNEELNDPKIGEPLMKTLHGLSRKEAELISVVFNIMYVDSIINK